MLALPGNLGADTFLERYWQKRPLFMRGALQRLRPAITRNELGWLATLEDVESRIVFTEHLENRRHYRVESGPFAPQYLQDLPRRDWTLLVHDVEKHLPAMRALFDHVPFIPDWRIDDLMVSFAAPGGSVGPHIDNYDVFLCQGIGVRNWRFTRAAVAADPGASDELALLAEFSDGEEHDAAAGDILYLPPGVAHWGIARRACMTYSIGMRAPQACDFPAALRHSGADADAFYADPDLTIGELRPGHISGLAAKRACRLLGLPNKRLSEAATALGRLATQNKDWLQPEAAGTSECAAMLEQLQNGGQLRVHGMSQIAFDEKRLYINGRSTRLPQSAVAMVEQLCCQRSLCYPFPGGAEHSELIQWMLKRGAFEIPENC
jgi:50S ribosomal protein L16 3-hydroxylase